MYRVKVDLKSRRGKPYDKANLVHAYQATQNGMSVYRAARVFSVPESKLRDRTRCNVALDASPSPDTILSWNEEKHLVDHIKYMGDIGYGYTKSNIQYMATEYCQSMGKAVKSEKDLSSMWFYAFMKRWPDLKLAKPQKLQMSRAKSASREAIDNYFNELGTVMQQNNLMEAPERIFNVDETGICLEHAPPKIVCAADSTPQAVTSPRSSNITINSGANAVGNNIPPFYIFPGKRWSNEFLEGAPAGSAGKMSETGWSNAGIFEHYVTEHLSKHAKLQENSNECTLIMYDGHKSHLSLTLTEWARKRNVILFVLPPHTSHLTQPLDVGVFGPFKCQYNKEFQAYLQKNPGCSITKYEVAQLTAIPYMKALCPENIVSAFRKSGIYPYNTRVITPTQVAPATIYEKDDTPTEDNPCESTSKPGTQQQITNDTSTTSTETCNDTIVLDNQAQDNSISPNHVRASKIQSFFNDRQITKVVQRKKKKFIPPYSVTGSLMKPSNVETSTIQAKKKENATLQEQTAKKSVQKENEKMNKSLENQAKPSTSGTGKHSKQGGQINLATPEVSSDSYSSDSEEEKCCACKLFQPKELRGCAQVVFVKWAQCDFCPHWTHLTYCSDVRVIRRGDVFKCPHCLNKV